MRTLKIAELFIYPTKSGRARVIDTALARGRGLEGDRCFMVVDEHGEMLTQRAHPELGQLETSVTDDTVTFQAQGEHVSLSLSSLERDERAVRVWEDQVVAEDCGPQAAGLVTHLTGRLARVVRIGRGYHRRVDPAYAEPDDEVSFADGFPILVTTRVSTDAVANAAGVISTSLRFRPNIVLDGAEPFEEDGWTTLRVGDVELSLVKPCTRCQVVDVDPATGQRGKAVLAALADQRQRGRGVIFGMNALVRREGILRVGDQVAVA